MTSSRDFRTLISRELLDLAYKNLVFSSIAVLINASVLSYLLWDVINHNYVIIWLAAMTLVTTVRYLSAWIYNKNYHYFTIERWNQILVTSKNPHPTPQSLK